MNRRSRLVAPALAATLAFSSGCSPSPERPSGGATARGAEAVASPFVRPGPNIGEPCGLAVAQEAVWILGCSGWIVRVPTAGGSAESRRLDGEVLALDGLTAAESGVWALLSKQAGGARHGSVAEIDPRTGAAGTTHAVGRAVPMHATYSGGRLWVGMLDGRLLALKDGLDAVDAGPPLVWTAADGAGLLWTVRENGEAVVRDPSSGKAIRRFAAVAPDAIAVAAYRGALWVATGVGGAHLIDAKTGRRSPTRLTGTVNAFATCGGAVWASQPDFGVRSLDASGTLQTSVRLDAKPRYLACDGSRLWILAEDGALGSLRID